MQEIRIVEAPDKPAGELEELRKLLQTRMRVFEKLTAEGNPSAAEKYKIDNDLDGVRIRIAELELSANITDEKKSAVAARNGFYEYYSDELVDGVEQKRLNVYRDEETIKKLADAIARKGRIPLTYLHPCHDVADDDFSQGFAFNPKIVKEGKTVFLTCEVELKGETKTAYDNGVRELSVGWNADFIPSDYPGIDYEQKFSSINHIALVPEGRAGSDCCIRDGKKIIGEYAKGDNMAFFKKKVTDEEEKKEEEKKVEDEEEKKVEDEDLKENKEDDEEKKDKDLPSIFDAKVKSVIEGAMSGFISPSDIEGIELTPSSVEGLLKKISDNKKEAEINKAKEVETRDALFRDVCDEINNIGRRNR